MENNYARGKFQRIPILFESNMNETSLLTCLIFNGMAKDAYHTSADNVLVLNIHSRMRNRYYNPTYLRFCDLYAVTNNTFTLST